MMKMKTLPTLSPRRSHLALSHHSPPFSSTLRQTATPTETPAVRPTPQRPVLDRSTMAFPRHTHRSEASRTMRMNLAAAPAPASQLMAPLRTSFVQHATTEPTRYRLDSLPLHDYDLVEDQAEYEASIRTELEAIQPASAPNPDPKSEPDPEPKPNYTEEELLAYVQGNRDRHSRARAIRRLEQNIHESEVRDGSAAHFARVRSPTARMTLPRTTELPPRENRPWPQLQPPTRDTALSPPITPAPAPQPT